MTDLYENRFAGETAIVTGAGSGIGRATAVRLAKEGARLVATDIVAARLDDLAEELGGLDVICVAGDVTDPAVIAKLLEAAGGPVDVLANVAGIMDDFLPTAEVDDAIWDRVFSVNVTGPMRLMRAVLPGMLDAGKGAIVNVASEAGMRGSAAGAAYTASKHAVVGLTRNTAFMYSPKGVRCNAVAPGAVRTNIEAKMGSQFAGERIGPFLQGIPPVAEPEELAAAICWLASRDSLNVSGAVLHSDGGWAAI